MSWKPGVAPVVQERDTVQEAIKSANDLVNSPIIKTDVNLKQQFCTVAKATLATTDVAIRNDKEASPELTEQREVQQQKAQQRVDMACGR